MTVPLSLRSRVGDKGGEYIRSMKGLGDGFNKIREWLGYIIIIV
jgi:hypothetical protein